MSRVELWLGKDMCKQNGPARRAPKDIRERTDKSYCRSQTELSMTRRPYVLLSYPPPLYVKFNFRAKQTLDKLNPHVLVTGRA